MTIGLVVLSLLMAVIVGWLMRQTLNVQPWQAQAALPAAPEPIAARPAIKTALWVFLGVASSLFALFVSAYAMRLSFGDWAPLPRPPLLMVNTVVLAAASVAMQWTVLAARRGNQAHVLRGLLASGALTLGFLAGQLVVWRQLHGAGYFVASSAATGFFYLLTAVHGAHVLGGLVAWARATLRVPRTTLAIELCATYWHFLFAIWIVLYLLLASNDFGLAICTTP